MSKFSLSLAAAATLASAPTLAQAPTRVDGRPSARVSYAELNLNSRSGMAMLDRRIQRAAKTLCVDERVRDLARASAGRACFAEAIASAQPQVERAVANAGSNWHLASSAKAITVSLRR
jgi:UrcA family protein